MAVKDGVVLEVGQSSTYGIYLKYMTNDNFKIMYAHLNKVLVKKGDKISSLDTLALSGNTGLSTGPHLHYSVWKDEKLINPINFVDLPHTEEVKREISGKF